ncbi:sulfotransferase family 2 domain-containing protein [Lentibacillus sediminis]|uniref:sulfotransferase family 2 domain-containing protein n=1 Tax=Lentibacillus sediminis TaxID=1940529 RepID=UPI0013040695|nr:sulfotransferase family 2 domain-containing protein [Lentibacillus sediminis]
MPKTEREVLIKKLITLTLPLYKKEFPIIFFWSPKSGCTSLIKWYYFQIGLLQKAIDYNPWIHFYRMEVYEKQENHGIKIAEQLLNDKKDSYKLVRNPYKRAVSSFFATIATEQLMNSVAPDINNGLSFKQFLYRIKDIGVKKGVIDAHIAQQYIEEEELIIQNYIQLEHFSTGIKAIENKYNLLHPPVENFVKSPHHVTQRMKDMGKGTFAEVKISLESLNKTLPQYRDFYDHETLDLVRELFKEDFEKYGYNQTDLKLL